MAKALILICDWHEGNVPAVTTVKVRIDGKPFDLDLCDDHKKELVSTVHKPSMGRKPKAVGRS